MSSNFLVLGRSLWSALPGVWCVVLNVRRSCPVAATGVLRRTAGECDGTISADGSRFAPRHSPGSRDALLPSRPPDVPSMCCHTFMRPFTPLKPAAVRGSARTQVKARACARAPCAKDECLISCAPVTGFRCLLHHQNPVNLLSRAGLVLAQVLTPFRSQQSARGRCTRRRRKRSRATRSCPRRSRNLPKSRSAGWVAWLSSPPALSTPSTTDRPVNPG